MSDSLAQNSLYVGNMFNAILYGVELVLHVKTVRSLSRLSARRARTKISFTVFSTVLFFLATVFVAVQAVFGQEMWVVHAGFEGGPTVYFAAHASEWYRVMGTTASATLVLMSDALLMYRCFVVYNNLLVLIFPFVLWTATLVFVILDLYVSAVRSNPLAASFTAHASVPYVVTSAALAVLLSSLISARIAKLCRASPADTTTTTRPRPILDLTTLAVESATLYAVAGIAFAVSNGTGSGISAVFESLYVMLACISPQMIVLRIADGSAWEHRESRMPSAIELPPATALDGDAVDFDSPYKVSSEMQFSSPDPDSLNRRPRPRPSYF